MIGKIGAAARRNPGPTSVPSAWKRFTGDIAASASDLHGGDSPVQTAKDSLRAGIIRMRDVLTSPISKVHVSTLLNKEQADSMRQVITTIRERQKVCLDNLSQEMEAFEESIENEDRFVVLVFGEVNAGKTALANHVAGEDFGETIAEFFVGEHRVGRLEEKATECTKEYQGFRLPGLLWIDCPGVLSTNAKNAALARRLVARADFVVLATSSDAPFKDSEMTEFANLVRSAGRECVDACIVVTKADRYDEDEDERTGRIIRKVTKKSDKDIADQKKWIREQLERHDLGKLLRFQDPIAVSVYVARDTMGRHWETGTRRSDPGSDWESGYRMSGIPDLLEQIGALLSSDGGRLKADWPCKRAAAITNLVVEAATQSHASLKKLKVSLKKNRARLGKAQEVAVEDAAQYAASRVGPCLMGNGIHRPGKFNSTTAHQEIREHLRKSVTHAVNDSVRDLLRRIDNDLQDSVSSFVAATQFDLNVSRLYRTQTYRSKTIGRSCGRAAGGAAGALGGAAGGAAIGSFICPGIGTLLGGLIGGIFGGWGGGKAGGAVGGHVYTQERAVTIPAGTNYEEVIAATQKRMRNAAAEIVADIFGVLDRDVFGNLLDEVNSLLAHLEAWHEVASSIAKAQPRPRRRSTSRRVSADAAHPQRLP